MAQSSIRELMKSYLDTRRFTDLTLKFFEEACSNGSKEASKSKIRLPYAAPKEIAMMVDFLYMDEYKVEDSPAKSLSNLEYYNQQHASLYRVGKKYGIPALCDYTIRMLASMISADCPNDSFLHVAKWTYKKDPDRTFQLRAQIVDQFFNRAEDFLGSDQDSEQLINLMQENYSFCKDIARNYLEILRRLNKKKSIGNVDNNESE
ncbi:MAG: hypothetical protein Q9212_005684 [Teloschistes hypoglaucus]